MRGYVRNNFPAFDEAAAKLRALGEEVFNPAERDREAYGPDIELWNEGEAKAHGFDIRDALAADLAWICRHADSIVLLPRWEHSVGARTEWALALALNLYIRYL